MKRYTETDKWRDPWFRQLPHKAKLLWIYLCDVCDHAGVVELDLEMASFLIGNKYTEEDLIAFGSRVRILSKGKIWLTKFISFQQGRLNPNVQFHDKIRTLLEKHGIRQEWMDEIPQDDAPGSPEEEPKKAKASRKKALTDEEFLQALRENPLYAGVNVDTELMKMDAWLLAHPHRKKERSFIVHWLNKAEKTLPPSTRPPGDYSGWEKPTPPTP